MAGNFRVYFPLESVALGVYCTQSGIIVHGLQSAGVNSAFNLDRVMELGQLEIYSLIETIPNVEVALEKVIDGYPLLYHLATQGATANNLPNRTNQRTDMLMNIYSDAGVASSGTPLTQVYCSGMYINSINYKLPLQGHLSESITLIGNDKIWSTSNFVNLYNFNNADAPVSGVKYRWNVLMGSGYSVFPSSIPGITVVTGSGYNMLTNGVYGAHVEDINVTCNLGREDLYELGRRRPYYRYVNFPVAVDTSINITTGGLTPGDLVNVNAEVDTTTNETIYIMIDEGTVLDLGSRNRLSSISYNGGAANGGVVTITYSYINYNDLIVYSPSDPAGLGQK